jgi:DNA-binding transcriptional LysR family regulator
MNLRFIETFVCVAHLRNFRMAAERLNSSQAAISNRIATLEEELGIKLFERDIRSVRLTIAGHTALPKAQKLLEVAADFYSSLSDPEVRRGSVSIGAIDLISYAWLPDFMELLKLEYPNIAVNLILDNSLNLKQKLADGEIELALMMGPLIDDSLHNIELFEFECRWVRSPALNLPDGHLTVAEMASQPILAYSPNSPPDQSIRQTLLDAGIRDARIYNANSFAATIRLALDGLGSGPLPVDIIRPHLDDGTLVAMDNDMPPLALRCHAIIPGDLRHTLAGTLAQYARRKADAYFRKKPDQ